MATRVSPVTDNHEGMTMRCLLALIRPWALIAGFAGALIAPGLAWTVDHTLGHEVRLIAPHATATVEINRALFVSGDPIAEIYGIPLSAPVRVIAPAADRLVRPREDPALVLLQVDKQLGENPLQAKTVWLFAKAGALGFALLGLVALALPRTCIAPVKAGVETAVLQ